MNRSTPLSPSGHHREASRPEETPTRTKDREALAHRFRHALQGGETSPLFHLVLRHRQETV